MKSRKLKAGFNFPETFTSTKLKSTIPVSRLQYTYPSQGGRVLWSESVTISLQRGVEFDIAKEFGCYEDSAKLKDFNPNLIKLVETGFLQEGKPNVKLDLNKLYELLVSYVKGSSLSVIYWKDRPIKPEIAELLKAQAELEEKLDSRDKEIEKLRELLTKNGLKA